MNRASAKIQIEQLRGDIERHDRLYYLDANPAISDAEYDKLYRQLENLEAEFPDLVNLDSPTQRVGGGPIGGFEQVPHAVPMLSIDDVFSDEELTRVLSAAAAKPRGGSRSRHDRTQNRRSGCFDSIRRWPARSCGDAR